MTDEVPAPPSTLPSELASLAVGLCHDAGIGLEVGPGGWFWDPVRRVIHVDAEGLEQHGPEYCAGIVAHEVGHFFISRYTMLPVDFPSLRAGRSLLNAIEDPRVDRWIMARYPGTRAWQKLALVDEMQYQLATPTFLVFCLECAAEGDRAWVPSKQLLPEEVVQALDQTREARRSYAMTSPPTDPDAPVDAVVPQRYRDEVWPLLTDARWLPARKEQRVQLSTFDTLQLAHEQILPAARALYELDRRRIACWLAQHPAHAGKGQRLLDQGAAALVVAQALSEGAPDQPPPPWASDLAQQLLDGLIDRRVQAPMVVHAGPRPHAVPWDEIVPELPPLPRVWRPATDYDRAHAEVADQVDQLVKHLEEILRPRRRLRERGGHPTGRRVDLRRLMSFEADPRRYDELWVRTTIPDRRNAAIGLLVDLSGSMSGEKAHSALLGTVLVAETLHRLEVPLQIDGFQDVLIPFQAFNEPLSAGTRQRISEMSQEVEGCREAGNNNPGYNDDGPCLLEFAEKVLDHPAADRILIVVSDGIPEGRRSTSSDLHAAVRKLRDEGSMRLIALGLGPHTQHVKRFYPESVADVPLPRFAETIGELIEGVLVGD